MTWTPALTRPNYSPLHPLLTTQTPSTFDLPLHGLPCRVFFSSVNITREPARVRFETDTNNM